MSDKNQTTPLQITGIGMIVTGITLCVSAGLRYTQLAEYYTPLMGKAANPFSAIQTAPNSQELINPEGFLNNFTRLQQEFIQAVRPVYAVGLTGAATSVIGIACLYAGKKHKFESNNVQVGGNYIQGSNLGSFVSVDRVSGTVTNSIKQLQCTSREQAWQLANLLAQLQHLIETSPTFKNEDKVEALEQLKTLSAAGQNPTNGEMQSRARTALKILKGTVAGLPAAAQLAVECNELLAMITKVLGLG